MAATLSVTIDPTISVRREIHIGADMLTEIYSITRLVANGMAGGSDARIRRATRRYLPPPLSLSGSFEQLAIAKYKAVIVNRANLTVSRDVIADRKNLEMLNPRVA